MKSKHGGIYRRYINGETDFYKLGKEYGVTGERIRQVVERKKKQYEEHPLLEAIEILGECEDELRYSTRVVIGRIDDNLLLKYNALVKDFISMIETLKNIDAGENDKHIPEMKKEELLNLPIEDLDLSVRAYNVLMRADIKTVGNIMAKSPGELRNVRNIGRHSLEEVISKMESLDTGYLAKYGKTMDDMESIVKGEE